METRIEELERREERRESEAEEKMAGSIRRVEKSEWQLTAQTNWMTAKVGGLFDRLSENREKLESMLQGLIDDADERQDRVLALEEHVEVIRILLGRTIPSFNQVRQVPTPTHIPSPAPLPTTVPVILPTDSAPTGAGVTGPSAEASPPAALLVSDKMPVETSQSEPALVPIDSNGEPTPTGNSAAEDLPSDAVSSVQVPGAAACNATSEHTGSTDIALAPPTLEITSPTPSPDTVVAPAATSTLHPPRTRLRRRSKSPTQSVENKDDTGDEGFDPVTDEGTKKRVLRSSEAPKKRKKMD